MTRLAEDWVMQSDMPDNVSVIRNSVLLSHRIRDLQRRRQTLLTQQDQARTQLPDWAIEPLRLVGMTAEEVRSLVDDWSVAETEAGLDDIERRLDRIDSQIEELEGLLIKTPSSTLEEVQSVLDLAISRFSEIIVTDQDNVFYDHGEARLLKLLERLNQDLCAVLQRERLDAS
jgi:hypothetical protein